MRQNSNLCVINPQLCVIGSTDCLYHIYAGTDHTVVHERERERERERSVLKAYMCSGIDYCDATLGLHECAVGVFESRE